MHAGMTNRPDLLDEALTRPGRIELKIEIGLPDERGRLQILQIHAGPLAKNGFLAQDVVLPELAERTKNFTGAHREAAAAPLSTSWPHCGTRSCFFTSRWPRQLQLRAALLLCKQMHSLCTLPCWLGCSSDCPQQQHVPCGSLMLSIRSHVSRASALLQGNALARDLAVHRMDLILLPAHALTVAWRVLRASGMWYQHTRADVHGRSCCPWMRDTCTPWAEWSVQYSCSGVLVPHCNGLVASGTPLWHSVFVPAQLQARCVHVRKHICKSELGCALRLKLLALPGRMCTGKRPCRIREREGQADVHGADHPDHADV